MLIKNLFSSRLVFFLVLLIFSTENQLFFGEYIFCYENTVENKIVGTPILKLAMVEIFQVLILLKNKSTPQVHPKELQGTLKKHQNCYKLNFWQISTEKVSDQSRFLEAPLVHQVDTSLKTRKKHCQKRLIFRFSVWFLIIELRGKGHESSRAENPSAQAMASSARTHHY